MVQNAQEKKTPLQLSLDEFGKRLSLAVLMVCAIIFFINVIRGETMADAFLFAVALAVAAIPEALSSIVTIVLALCTRTMAQENAIVRKLSSVESLGGVGVICTDKTGTLTQNKMTVTACNTFSKKEEPALVCASVLCNDAVIDGEKEIGDPTETALLNFAEKKEKGYVKQIQSTFQRKASIPFDSNRKCMSVCYKKEEEEKFFLITKGAVDVLLKQMTKKLEAGEIRKITKEDREKIKQLNEGFTEKGLRVLAFAGKRIEPLKETMQQEKIEQELCYLGLMAMSDPPRKESQESIKKCKEAGILTVMITGDHPKTAEAIAKEIGILSKDIGEELVLTGAELEEMSDEELRNKVLQTRVYARVSPKHKIRIVRAWQERGMITAMTGDGVNDAPSLKQADVGVAMGNSGTEAAKEAADMILADDNFATIVKAIQGGRNIYSNIKKSIGFLLSGNTAGILCVLTACITGLSLPFVPVQLLFINLVTDSLPAVALGMNPHTNRVMQESPRKATERIMDKGFLKRVLLEGGIIAINTMLAFLIGKTSAYAFGVLCLSRLLHGYSCKSAKHIVGKKEMWNNLGMNGAFLGGFLLLNLVFFIPILGNIFQTANLGFTGILYIYGFSILSFLEIQITKAITIRKN
ncbi:MAG: cation-translocating P-type ATPase, partial [Lachnospiraceae bacterium]